MKHIVTVWIVCCWLGGAWGQCVLQGPFPVQAFDVLSLELEIDSAEANDLATSAQGVCGVRIRFTHEYVGDMILQLVSPAGQTVTLIGPTGPYGITQFSNWDISFLPCSASPMPDLGFPNRYSNQNAWGQFGSFNGTYHPFLNCLEDFDTGTVNGTWTVQIRDQGAFYNGEIESIQILFCDPSGLSCNNCILPDITPVSDSLAACNSIILSDSLFETASTYDSRIHTTRYILHAQDSVHEAFRSLDSVVLQESGIYELCPLVLLKNDTMLFTQLWQQTESWNELTDSMRSQELCLTIGDCLPVIIQSAAEIERDSIYLCQGDSVVWFGRIIKDAGQYTFVDSTKSCPITYELVVKKLVQIHQILQQDTLSCLTDSIHLAVTPFDTSLYQYSWVVDDSIRISNVSHIIRTQPGAVLLEIANSFCTDHLMYDLEQLKIPYLLSSLQDTISCKDSLANFSVRTDSLVEVYWTTLDQSDTLLGRQFQTMEPGRYLLHLYVPDCKVVDTLQVVSQRQPPSATIDHSPVYCAGDSIPLRILGPAHLDVNWEGPNMFQANVRDTFSRIAGWYTAVITDSLTACQVVDSAFFQDGVSISLPTIQSDSLTCRGSIRLLVSPLDSSLSYVWLTPNGDSMPMAEPYISDTGRYILVLRKQNCIDTSSYQPPIADLSTRYQLIGDSLSCSGEYVIWTVRASQPLDSIFWVDPLGDTLWTDSLRTNIGGSYQVHFILGQDCRVSREFQVEEKFHSFPFQLLVDTLNCFNDSATARINGPDSFTYAWTGPRQYADSGQQIQVRWPGRYIVQVNDGTCILYKQVRVEIDTILPRARLEVRPPSCMSDTAQVRLQSADPSTTLALYDTTSEMFIPLPLDRWIGTGESIVRFRIQHSNGCFIDTTVRLLFDSFPPSLQYQIDTWNCESQALEGQWLGEKVQDIEWRQNGQKLSDSLFVRVASLSDIELFVTGENGCSARYRIPIPVDTMPPILPTPDTILQCDRLQFTFRVPDSILWTAIVWESPDGTVLQNEDEIVINQPGTYQYQIEALNGCTAEGSWQIEIDTLTPLPRFSERDIPCDASAIRPLLTYDSLSLQGAQWVSARQVIDSINPLLGPASYLFRASYRNGCADSVRVDIKQASHDILISQLLMTDTLRCGIDSILLAPVLSEPALSLFWLTPVGDTIRQSAIMAGQVGQYSFWTIDSNRCVDSFPVRVEIDTFVPGWNIISDSLNCKKEQATLRIRPDSITAIDRVRWQGPNGWTGNGLEVEARDTGRYEIYIRLANDCEDQLTTVVQGDFEQPTIQLSDTGYINCESRQAIIRAEADISDTLRWYNMAGLGIGQGPILRTQDTGWITLKATARNGCETEDSIYIVPDLPFSQLRWDVPDLDCDMPVAQVIPQSTDSIVRWIWEGPNEFRSQIASPSISDTGQYIVRYTNVYDCETVDTIIVKGANLPPQVLSFILDTPQCKDSMGLIRWESPQGPLIVEDIFSLTGGAIEDQWSFPLDLEANNTYVIELRLEDESCIVKDTIHLMMRPPEPIPFRLESSDIYCNGDTSGGFSIFPQDQSGSPYSYTVDGMQFGSQNQFTRLLEGIYQFQIQDRKGCVTEDQIAIENRASEVSFTIGEDREVNVGDSILIQAETNIPMNEFRHTLWLLNRRRYCDSCLTLPLYISASYLVGAEWETKGGCVFMDEMEISVPTDELLFIPNIFTPDANGNNDIFYVQTPSEDIPYLDWMHIYDRWGNRVYECTNCPLNDIASGWDGTFEGKELFPQVLTVVVAFHVEGRQRIERQSLSLVR